MTEGNYVCLQSCTYIRQRFLHTGQGLSGTACCDETRPAVVNSVNVTIIETIDYPQQHADNTVCQWIIQPDNVPEVSVIKDFRMTTY